MLRQRNFLILIVIIACLLFMSVVETGYAQPQPPVYDSALEQTGVDVVVVMDRSGSMSDDGWDSSINDYQPIGSAKIAAATFVRLMDMSRDQVALVSFNSSAYLNQPLTTNRQVVIDVIGTLNAGGGTNIAAAIDKARVELLGANHKPDNALVMIVLSDGQNGGGGGPVIAAADTAKNAGVRVFSIGLGSGVDADTMRQAASSADDYYFAPTAGDLQEIYNKIARGVRPDPQGTLRLSVADSYRADANARVSVSVFNGDTLSQTYTIRVQLKHLFSVIQSYEESQLVAFGSTFRKQYDFGSLDPDLRTYTVVVDLYDDSGVWLDTEFASFIVGDELEALNAGKRLTDAAKDEVNIIQNMLVEDTARTYDVRDKSFIEFMVSLVSNYIPWVTSQDLPITADAISNMVGEFVDGFVSNKIWDKYRAANSEGERKSVARGTITPKLEAERLTIDSEDTQFREYLDGQTVSWQSEWNKRVSIAEEFIRSRIEQARVAYFIDLDIHWSVWPPSMPDPDVHRISFSEFNDKFDWFVSEERFGGQWWLNGLSIIAIVLIIGILIIILIIPSGEELPAAAAILASLKSAGAIIGAVGAGKAAAVLLIVLLTLALYSNSGTGPVAETIVAAQADGLNEIRQLLGGNKLAADPLPAEARLDGRTLMIQAGRAQEVYIYTPYGALMDRLTFIDGRARSLSLPPGKYSLITTDHALTSTSRQDLTIEGAAVTLSTTVVKPIRPSDTNFDVSLTVSNDGDSAIGPLTLVSSILNGEGLEMWEVNLGPYETKEFSYSFTVPGTGAYVLEAYIEDGVSALDETFTGLVVGQAPAFVADVMLATSYPPQTPIDIPVTVENQGNLTGHAEINVEIINLLRAVDKEPVVARTFALDLGAGKSSVEVIDLGTTLPPGLYRLSLHLNGVMFGSRTFINEAEGAVFAIPRIFGPVVDVNQTAIPYEVTLVDEMFNPIDAPLVMDVRDPNGDVTQISPFNTGVGEYYFSIPAPIEGTYSLRVNAEHAGRYVVNVEDYAVRGSAGFIYPNIIGGLADDRTRPLSIALENELGQPVPDARVTIADTNGGQTAVSDADGIASIVVTAIGSVEIVIEKPGYADTTFTLPTKGATQAQDLWLVEGWNLISFAKMPADQGPAAISSPVRLDLERIIGFESGIELLYDPKKDDAENTLLAMSPEYGYWVWVTRDVVWPVEGDSVAVDTPISLQTGWNLISYLPDAPMSVETALTTILDNVEVVRGFTGRGLTYHRGMPEAFSTLRNLSPGMGYWVKMKEPDTLIYPDPAALSSVEAEFEPNPSPEEEVTTSRLWADLYASRMIWNATPVSVGSEITVFGEDDALLGRGKVTEPGVAPFLPVYGDDPLTPEDEGASPGESLRVAVNGAAYPLAQPLLWDDRAFLNPVSTATISGAVVDELGSPLSGITIRTDTGLAVDTDAGGQYTFADLLPGTYMISASETSYYTFAPESYLVEVPPDATSIDFTGLYKTFSINGWVMDGETGLPMAGVEIRTQFGDNALSDKDGFYLLPSLAADDYILTPWKAGYYFTPSLRQVTVPPQSGDQNFTGWVDAVEYKLFIPTVSSNFQ